MQGDLCGRRWLPHGLRCGSSTCRIRVVFRLLFRIWSGKGHAACEAHALGLRKFRISDGKQVVGCHRLEFALAGVGISMVGSAGVTQRVKVKGPLTSSLMRRVMR